mmetsp:Transcript_19562/g.56086  ORF Transcript_19562/g.56086 Transcript_19562/m.56086 type:complete len:512 (+) Transcript_19562:236-1771(+)
MAEMPEGYDLVFSPTPTDAEKRLVHRIMHRRLPNASSVVTRLVRRGARPASLRMRIERRDAPLHYNLDLSLVGLAIDDVTGSYVSAYMDGDDLKLPCWSSREEQREVLETLIRHGCQPGREDLKTAISMANAVAVEVLLAHGVAVGSWALVPPRVNETPADEYCRKLLQIYQSLVERDASIIAVPQPVHQVHVARLRLYPETFTEGYLDLVLDKGASVAQLPGNEGATLLSLAAMLGCRFVVAYLSKHLPIAQIDAVADNGTALAIAGMQIRKYAGADRQADYCHVARSLLRAGASIEQLLTPLNEDEREQRRLVVDEYEKALNELPDQLTSALNDALRPHRCLAEFVAFVLTTQAPHSHPAIPDQEASLLAWRIAAFCIDLEAAHAAATRVLRSDFPLGRRINTAMAHFVTCAATKTASNKEVVGGVMEVRGQTVSIPPLQCFAVSEGGSKREIGLREVVHKARMDEASKYGITGITKGFNEHLAGDCVFEWPQLGYCDKKGCFVSMAIE